MKFLQRHHGRALGRLVTSNLSKAENIQNLYFPVILNVVLNTPGFSDFSHWSPLQNATMAKSHETKS